MPKKKEETTYQKSTYQASNQTEVNPEMERYGKYIFIGAFCLIGLFVILSAVYTIDAGERGVILTFGKASDDEAQPGIHLKVPIMQKIIKWETRTQKIKTTADAASNDLQDVQTEIALQYHLSENQVSDLYQKIGKDYRERIIHPSIQESVKAVTARYKAEELITKRPEVREGIRIALKERLANYFIIVDDFNIVNFQFSEEFDKAVEAKVTAEQKKLQADRDLQRILIEKEQKIAQAQAQAESLRLQKQEVTPELVELRRIEAQMEAIKKWNGQLPLMTGGGMPFIDVTSVESTAKSYYNETI